MHNPICTAGTHLPYHPSENAPWNEQRVKHLYRRIGYGMNPTILQNALNTHPLALVDQLINKAIQAPLFEVPEWVNENYLDYGENDDLVNEHVSLWMRKWLEDMAQHDVRGKLILFWHNHFVAQLETYYFPAYLYEYHKILQTNALGNFKTFVQEMGKSTAMLLFLNGAQNNKYEPNENYARELYELFTLGRDNGYTQEDIEETAKALTGWNHIGYWGDRVTFKQEFFDAGQKTIFGQTGNWGYDEVHDILFEERKEIIASFICGKLYKAYVNPTIDRVMVNQMAITLLENDWEIAPVLRLLFKSKHFFSEANMGVLIKSPYELYFNFYKEVEYEIDTQEDVESINYFTGMLGQELGTPVDVAGWQGNRSWIDTARLTGRWRTLSWRVYDTMEKYPTRYTDLAFQLVGENTNDPMLVVQKVMDYFLPVALHTPETYEKATEIFKGEIPKNYFDNGEWNLSWDSVPWQMTLLIQYIIRIPEYQLI